MKYHPMSVCHHRSPRRAEPALEWWFLCQFSPQAVNWKGPSHQTFMLESPSSTLLRCVRLCTRHCMCSEETRRLAPIEKNPIQPKPRIVRTKTEKTVTGVPARPQIV